MNEWMNEWMKTQLNEHINEWTMSDEINNISEIKNEWNN